jgi:hypothetical protein
MNLACVYNGQQFFNDAGIVLSGGKINTYLAGTSTPAATYTDTSGGVANANPIILLSNGRAPQEIWIPVTVGYKFVLTDSLNNILQTLDNIIALPDSSNINFLQTGAGAILRTAQSKMADILSVFDFMTTAQISDVQTRTASLDVTSAINAADVAATAGKKMLYIPGGKYSVTALTLNSPHIFGDGWFPGSGSQLHGSTASGVIVTLPTGGTIFEGFSITSAIAAGSRTGPGVKITGGAQVLCRDVTSNGHKYGFWNQGVGNEYEHCFAQSNNNDGFFFDGSVTNLNETGVYFCQSNANTGNGFTFAGPGTGIFLARPTAAGNSGHGIALKNTGLGPINDFYVSIPEMSGNTLNGVDTTTNNGVSLNIVGGLIEGAAGSIGVNYQAMSGSAIAGTTIGGGTEGIRINADSLTIASANLGGQSVAAIRYGVSSIRSAIGVFNIVPAYGTTAVGILIDGGASAFTIGAGDVTGATTAQSGNTPAGSKIGYVQGLNNFNNTFIDTVAIPRVELTLANGLNSNIATANRSYLRSGGPTGVYSIGGFDLPKDGRIIYFQNNVGQTLTIVNEDASSTAVNRITTLTGGNVVLRAAGQSFATFIYDSGQATGRWILVATN